MYNDVQSSRTVQQYRVKRGQTIGISSIRVGAVVQQIVDDQNVPALGNSNMECIPAMYVRPAIDDKVVDRIDATKPEKDLAINKFGRSENVLDRDVGSPTNQRLNDKLGGSSRQPDSSQQRHVQWSSSLIIHNAQEVSRIRLL